MKFFRVNLLSVFLLAAFSLNAQTSPQKTIALTFDDLPFAPLESRGSAAQVTAARQATLRILATLARHHAPAIGFVNEEKLNNPGHRDAAAAILDDWLKAGYSLGNHTYSHPALSNLTLEDYEADILRGDVITSARMKHYNKQERYFRLPFLDYGNTQEKWQGLQAFLAAHKYINAPVTYQDLDWLYSSLYERALSGSDKRIPQSRALAAKIRAEYLRECERQLAFSESSIQRSVGHPIPLISLMHADSLNAGALDAVLTMFEQHGYRFISIDEAMSDPAYSIKDAFADGDGLLWQFRWMPTLGKPMDFSGNPPLPDWVDALWKKIQ
jgi:peptidoglycan/xylan/chitin deacetylase (PgdA/CDA1 family)